MEITLEAIKKRSQREYKKMLREERKKSSSEKPVSEQPVMFRDYESFINYLKSHRWIVHMDGSFLMWAPEVKPHAPILLITTNYIDSTCCVGTRDVVWMSEDVLIDEFASMCEESDSEDYLIGWTLHPEEDDNKYDDIPEAEKEAEEYLYEDEEEII